MPLSVTEELRRTFELATLRHEARSLRSPRQWREAFELRQRCDDARTREEQLYASRYQTRVEVRRRQLIDEAGQRGGWELRPYGIGHDRFSREATLRQAQRDVRHAHHNRIQRIDDVESRALAALLARSSRANELQGLARDDFTQATDRRSGPERRRSMQRKR